LYHKITQKKTNLLFNQENDDFYINETANIIQHKIFEYVRRGMHPLCEYLDIDNMENYVRWLLNE
jgi:hypothetical protein